MLGDIIAEEKGRILAQRVLDVNVNGKPRLEVSAVGEGMIKGNIEYTETWTYKTEERSDCFQYGKGIGVMTLKDDNNQIVNIRGQGIGRMTKSGIMRYVGADFYSTSCSGRLSFMNELVGIFEYELDKTGYYTAKV
ncbi:MAG: hypothetical protein ACPKQO_06645, partial [Nitrososphaeraceae archaeon]